MAEQQPDKPGRYESPLEQFPGFIQFPSPFMLHHVQAWWEAAVEPLAEKKKIEFAYWQTEWHAAKRLVLEYGEWAIEGVPVGDVKADRVPAEVVNFVLEASDDYVAPKLPPKMRRLARSIT